jgi:hypothetical protein
MSTLLDKEGEDGLRTARSGGEMSVEGRALTGSTAYRVREGRRNARVRP